MYTYNIAICIQLYFIVNSNIDVRFIYVATWYIASASYSRPYGVTCNKEKV